MHLPQERWEKPQVCVYYRGLSLAIQDRTGRQFAASDKVGNAWAVDGVGREADGFGDSQTGGVTDGQKDAVLKIIHSAQEARDFVLAQDDGKLFRLPAGGNIVLDRPWPLESNGVENRRAETMTMIELAARCLSCVKWSR